MSFGWSTTCLGLGKLSILLAALVVVACSYIVSFNSFEVAVDTGAGFVTAEFAAPDASSIDRDLASLNIIGPNSQA
ncbi:MAG: hypothetical protein ACU84Q_17565 [Gammaproteobacteria bacterium]